VDASGVETRRVTRTLLVVFFFSGCASLMYQVAWQRLLTVYYGLGAVSVALIVSVYMFGLGVGALAGGAAADRARSPLTLYLAIESSIALFGASSPWLLSALGSATAGSGYVMTCLWLFAFLAIPTLLMGMTLPMVVKMFHRATGNFFDAVGALYAINTLGAAFGTLFSAYVVVSLWGLDRTIEIAAAINALLAVVVWRLRSAPWPADAASAPPYAEPLAALVYPIVFVTGFLAIGYEIVWFRLVSVLVKDSPYAFASALAVYLTGIAAGSLAAVAFVRTAGTARLRQLFFVLQWLIGCYVVASVTAFYYAMPRGPLASLARRSFATLVHPPPVVPASLGDIVTALDIFIWPALLFLVPTLLMGASFPLIAALGLTQPAGEARTLARVYACTILGNVAGGLVTAFVLLPWLHTEPTLRMFAVAGVLMVLLASTRTERSAVPRMWRIAATAAPIALALMLFPGAGRLYAAMHVPPAGYDESVLEEGRDAIVITYLHGDAMINYINGSSHGSRPGYGFYYETIETLSHAPHAKTALVIGLGTGSILEQVLAAPQMERATVVEINATSVANLRKLPLFQRLLSDPRVDLVVDDGRRYLLRTTGRFDLVLMDPLRTKTAYSTNIYSAEIARIIRDRLAPGGVAMVWTDEFHVLPRTWASVFPHARLYSYFLICSTDPLARDAALAERLIAQHGDAGRRAIEAYDHSYVGDRDRILAATASYPLDHDWAPVTEYFLGLAVRHRGEAARWW